jgi:hypothetical protein
MPLIPYTDRFVSMLFEKADLNKQKQYSQFIDKLLEANLKLVETLMKPIAE